MRACKTNCCATGATIEFVALSGVGKINNKSDARCDKIESKHLNYNIVQRHFKSALQRAGIPTKSFHNLRHSYAVASLRAGDDVKTVQENLGHHTAAFTLDQYGHVTESMRRDSSARMEAYIQGLKTGR